jgi:MFS family permease
MKHLHSFTIRNIYTTTFFFALQVALASYINSTFLSGIVSEKIVAYVFAGSAILTLIALSEMPTLLRAFGNRRLLLGLLIVNFTALFMVTHGNQAGQVGGILFYLISNNLIVFTFDIFVEHFSKNKNTGVMRGLYLTVINCAWIFAPLLAGMLLTTGGYHLLYSISMAFIFIVFYLTLTKLTNYHDAPYKRFSFLQTLINIGKNPDLRNITVINFVLQFFYATMVIYTPLYMHNYLGFSWTTIGFIFTIMLLPFVFIQYPLGRYADKVGERSFLLVGLVILGASTFLLAFIEPNIWTWAIVLFMTRVGAAVTEVMTEVYFFKKVNDAESNYISIFRDMSPLAYIIAPLAGICILSFGTFSTLYIILGIIVLSSLYYAFSLRDTSI